MTIRATATLVAFSALLIGTSAALAHAGGFVAARSSESAPAADRPSEALARVTRWVIASRDNGTLPFIVIDKVTAELFVFDSLGQSLGRAPVLIGIGKGDDSAPGVGEKALSRIPVSQRTTPAGRFVAKYGAASGHQQVLWVDYANSISLHPVVTSNRSEHRLQRLQSPSPDDNRITYGCINVPAAFYKNVVRPLFNRTGGLVYILPESRTLNEVFVTGRLEQLGDSAEVTR